MPPREGTSDRRRAILPPLGQQPGRDRSGSAPPPLALDEIFRDILPYRANRRALQLDTSEDYELVLLRLCAGEGSLVRTEPEEARARFAQEIRSANPDLDVLHAFENVEVTLRAEALARALEAEPEGSYAPPGRRAEPEIDPALVLGRLSSTTCPA